MRRKGHQAKYSLMLLFVGIFAFWWGIAVLAQNDKAPTPTMQAATALPQEMIHASLPSINGALSIHVVKNSGTYSYSGNILLSSPCEELGIGIASSGSSTVHVTIPLTLFAPSNGCNDTSEGTSSAPFSASLSVSPGAKVVFDGVTINGVIVATTLTSKAASQ